MVLALSKPKPTSSTVARDALASGQGTGRCARACGGCSPAARLHPVLAGEEEEEEEREEGGPGQPGVDRCRAVLRP